MSSRTEQKREPDLIDSVGSVPASRTVIKGVADPLTDIIGTVNEIVVTPTGIQLVISLSNNTVIPGAPTIADFTNSGHDHSDAAGGGTVSHVDITNKESDGEPHTVSKAIAPDGGTTELSVANGFLTNVIEEYVLMTVTPA